ncbi:MAG: hypothetical protein ACLUD2_20800 [Clostridium sp.]
MDRYDIYEYDTLPSPLTETQTKRLFWAYPSNWTALKEAARKFDPELYGEIASTASGPNVVKRVKDDPSTRFAWVADHPEIEERAIAAMEQMAADGGEEGKEAPDAIRDATSEETAVPFTVRPSPMAQAPWIQSFSWGVSLSGILRRSSPRASGTTAPQEEMWAGWTRPRTKI